MPGKTADYHSNRAVSYPPTNRSRRKRRGCSCDSNYAKSLQGICKVVALILAFLTCIIIGASPYYRTIFVLEGVTWPFHIVMLLVSLLLLVTLGMYVFFLTGQHLEYPHIAWPTIELAVNITSFLLTLLAVILETTNVWRWDYSRGYQTNSINGGANFNGLSSFGYSAGIPLTNQLNMNSYCARYPTDCRDYFSLFAGNNSYHGNHIFACIALFALLICYLVSSIFAYRTWRVFKREMTNGVVNTQPSAWARLRFRMSEIKMPESVTSNIRDKFGKLLNRNNDDDDVTADVELVETGKDKMKDKDMFVDLKEKRFVASSVHSDDRKSSKHGRSRYDDHSDNRSRASSKSKRHHRDDEMRHYDHEKHHHDDEKHDHEKHHHDHDGHNESRSSRSGRSSRSSKQRSHDRSSHRDKEKKESVEAKNASSIPTDGPVASFIC